jgi:hypothetical protein
MQNCSTISNATVAADVHIEQCLPALEVQVAGMQALRSAQAATMQIEVLQLPLSGSLCLHIRLTLCAALTSTHCALANSTSDQRMDVLYRLICTHHTAADSTCPALRLTLLFSLTLCWRVNICFAAPGFGI